MNINRKTQTITVACSLAGALVLAAVGIGCYFGGRHSLVPPQTANGIVSYLSGDSKTYSSTSEVVEAVADTVVEIRTETVTTQWGHQYIVSGAGSGVIVGSGGELSYIVTNNHVIAGANDITVTTRAGESFAASLVATDDSADIAVVTVACDNLPVAVWGNSDDLKIGDDLIAIGNPLGSLGGTVTKGILSAAGRTISVGNFAMTLLQTDTAINPGNSGGGLFNMHGELIGVVNAKTTDEEIEGICFAIPANTARAVYNDLVQYGYLVGRATLNVEVAEGTINAGVNTQPQTIVYVTAVKNAAEGTFMQYDRIDKINGATISSVLELNAVLAKIKPGDSVEVTVFRGTLSQGWMGNSLSFASETTVFRITAAQYGA